jgi:hypothetical protein
VNVRRALVPVAQLLFLSLLSCQENATRLAPSPVVADAKAGFVIMADLPLYAQSQGALTPHGTIPLGEKLSLLGPTVKVSQSGKEREFLEVKRESGSHGWARADYVISKSVLAVVTSDDAMIYAAADDTAATTTAIPRLTVLAIHAETAGMRFIKVTAFVPAEKVLLRNVWLRNDGVSSNIQDIEAAILWQLAESSTDAKQQQAFLTSAIKDNPQSLFMSDLKAALAALSTPSAPPPASPASGASTADDRGGAGSPLPTVAATGSMIATDDSVSVYDSPDQTSGAIIGVLPKGQIVDVLKKTAASVTIGDANAPWYRIQSPPGWVFGGSLAPAR